MQTPNGLSPFHLIFNLWMLWTVFSKSAAAEAVEEKPNLANVQSEPPSTSTETDIDVLQDKLLETANFSWLLGLLGENEKWPLMKQLEEGEEEEYPSCSEKELQAADRRCIDQVVATAHLLHLPPHPNQMALLGALFNLINSGQNDKRKKVVGCHSLEQYLACLVGGRCSRCSYPEATVADFARIRFLSAYSSRCPESFPDDVHHLLKPECSASTWGTFHPKTGPAPGSCLPEAQKMACYGRVYPPDLGFKVKNWEEAFYRSVTAVLYDQKEAGHRENCERLLKLGKCQLEVACKGGGGGGDHHSQKSPFCSETEVNRLKSLFRFLLSYHRRRQISSNDGGGGGEHNWANCLDKGWVNLEQLEEVVTESCPKNPKTTLSSTTTTNSNSTTTTSTKKWSSTNKKPHPHHHRKTSTSDSSDSEKNDHHHHPHHHHHHHRHSSTTSPLKILIIVGWSLLATLLVGLLIAYCCLCTERKRRQQKKMRDFYAAAQNKDGKLIKSGGKSKSSLGLNNSRNYSEDGGGEVGASVSFVVFSKSKSVLPGSAASSQQALGGKKSKKVLPPTSASKASSSGVPPASPGGGGGGGKVSSLIGGKGGGGKKSKAAKTSGKVFAGKSKLGAGKK